MSKFKTATWINDNVSHDDEYISKEDLYTILDKYPLVSRVLKRQLERN